VPLRHAPVTVELTINQNIPSIVALEDNAHNTQANTNFSLRRVRLLASVVDVDMALTERINRHLLQGGSLPIPYHSWSTTMTTAADVGGQGGSLSVQLSRQYTRVRLALVYFSSIASERRAGAVADAMAPRSDGSKVNSFPAPMADSTYNAALDQMRAQLTSGAMKWPEMPIETYSEGFYYLMKALNMLTGEYEQLGIEPRAYHSNQFCLAFDLESAGTGPGAHGANFTGLNLRASELLRFEMRDIFAGGVNDAARAENVPAKVFMSLMYDAIAQVKLDAVDLFE
jgi:hypothetical protein